MAVHQPSRRTDITLGLPHELFRFWILRSNSHQLQMQNKSRTLHRFVWWIKCHIVNDKCICKAGVEHVLTAGYKVPDKFCKCRHCSRRVNGPDPTPISRFQDVSHAVTLNKRVQASLPLNKSCEITYSFMQHTPACTYWQFSQQTTVKRRGENLSKLRKSFLPRGNSGRRKMAIEINRTHYPN